MNLTNIAKTRLASQQIQGTKFQIGKDIVGWMGAMQAQDYAMAKWAVGVRLPDSTDQMIETALNKGEIIRTHLLRPTWHIVSAEDIYWMLELTAPQIRSALTSRHVELDLTEAILAKSNSVIEKSLGERKQLTREELVAELGKAKIATDNNRASHLFLWAELAGIMCSGPIQWGKQTYALLEDRAPKTPALTREEALAQLARKYFSSRCPATLQDFAWWSGLSASDAKQALEFVKTDFISETYHMQTYWSTRSSSLSKADNGMAYLLPAYDEFIISYKDRGASLPLGHFHQAISSNGIFRPIIVVAGQVVGIWKRTIKKDLLIVEAELFTPLDLTVQALIEQAAVQFGNFLEKKEISFRFGEFNQ